MYSFTQPQCGNYFGMNPVYDSKAVPSQMIGLTPYFTMPQSCFWNANMQNPNSSNWIHSNTLFTEPKAKSDNLMVSNAWVPTQETRQTCQGTSAKSYNDLEMYFKSNF
mmetsp:Transcript_41165/g.47393  ORF Transcript_41165/g.47393 Transcript_41165/m.47393 type:complete len:108 (+) Transcript_41165:46-369(+)